MNLREILATLSNRRPVFHSETDFQHELAWEIHTTFPGSAIRLEYPINVSGRRMEIDMSVTHENIRIAIELKYKTKRASPTHHGEAFNLAQQAATPLGRYDYWRDVERLEYLRASEAADETWAILLTNDGGYWSATPARGNGTQFSSHDTRHVGPADSPLAWISTLNTDSIGKARVPAIPITQTYQLDWADYSIAPHRLRYLALDK